MRSAACSCGRLGLGAQLRPLRAALHAMCTSAWYQERAVHCVGSAQSTVLAALARCTHRQHGALRKQAFALRDSVVWMGRAVHFGPSSKIPTNFHAMD